MELIKKDLKLLGISHDNFFSETEIVNKDLVNKAVKKLKEKNFVEEGFLQPPKGETNENWKKIKRLIFKSTLFGDDTDRALQKNDGSWTYFANDVAYHMDKVNRNYKNLVNILGADHTGYIKRITAAVSALSENKIKLNCKVCQLVKLYKNGEPFKMSKRAGEFISAQDLLNEVEKDQIRFMMLNRSNDVELDFDFDKVKEKTKDNPVFYVQYAYARINSLLRTLNLNLLEKINLNENNINFNEIEEKIIRKVFEWPKIIESASRKFDLHKIPFYLYELSTLFHAYWSKGNEDKNYKFIENEKIKRKEILSIINLVAYSNTKWNENSWRIITKKNVMKKVINIFFFFINNFFFFITYKYYSSQKNIEVKNFNRNNIDEIINKKISNLPILKNDTNNVIEFNDGFSNKIKNDKPRSFWNLLKSK